MPAVPLSSCLPLVLDPSSSSVLPGMPARWAGERREGLSLPGCLLLWLLEGSKMCQNDFFALLVHVSYPDSEKA